MENKHRTLKVKKKKKTVVEFSVQRVQQHGGNRVLPKGAQDSETHFHSSETGEGRERGLDTRRGVYPLHHSKLGNLPLASVLVSLCVHHAHLGAFKEPQKRVSVQSSAAYPLSTGKPNSANQFNLRRLLVLKTNFMFNFLSKGQGTQYVFIFLCSTIKQMLVRTKKIS